MWYNSAGPFRCQVLVLWIEPAAEQLFGDEPAAEQLFGGRARSRALFDGRVRRDGPARVAIDS